MCGSTLVAGKTQVVGRDRGDAAGDGDRRDDERCRRSSSVRWLFEERCRGVDGRTASVLPLLARRYSSRL